jgi:hypothetical protein
MCGYWAARAALKHTFGIRALAPNAQPKIDEQMVDEQRLQTTMW